MLLVDGHVHVYDCFGVGRMLDAAAANFAAAARAIQCEGRYQGVLCLVESAQERFIDGVRTRRAGRVFRGKHGYWEAEQGDEPETLVVRCGCMELALIAGRQIVTRERLEVLALGTTARLRDGEPIEATLGAVLESGAAAVLPWGVGKWLGARGAIVARVLADPRWRDVSLGDNGNRLELGPEPSFFAAARRAGRAVLPGTDPLPLPGEEARVGSFGFAVDAALDPLRPTAALLAILKSTTAFTKFGRRAGLPRFIGQQVKLQLKSRLAPRAA
jgi:hypothetical protein